MRNKFYARAWRILRPIVLFFLPVELRGTENLEDEAAILCANHSQRVGPHFAGAFHAPELQPADHGEKQLFSIPLVRWFLRNMGVFPVDRGNSDIGAVKTAITSLRDNWNLLIFPEGTRVKRPGQVTPKSGAGMMAIRAGVKMVPVFIGTKKRLFRKTPIIFGKPFTPAYTGRKGTAEEYQANTDEVMRRVYELGGVPCL